MKHEEALVVQELKRRHIPYTLYTEKRIHRRQLPLDDTSLLVGDMPCVYGALKQLHIPIPSPNSYPHALKRFLHRKMWTCTLEALEVSLRQGADIALFAKPTSKEKRFTGQVFSSEHDLFAVQGISRKEPLVCSEVVRWMSEYRAYVVDGKIRACDHYAGDDSILLDDVELQHAVAALEASHEAYAGYAIDFGVLHTGETALVELNDGFAVGAYAIGAKDYTDMIIARWQELLKGIPQKNSPEETDTRGEGGTDELSIS